MANWAAGAGFSNAFLNTLKGLTDLERSQLELAENKRKIEQEKALDTAFANSQARVGQKDDYGVAIQQASGNTVGGDMGQARMLSQQGALSGGTAEDMEFERASAEAAAGAMRENAARQGKVADAALPRMEAQEYTSKQAMGDYTKEAAKVGGRRGALEALQMKKVFRQDELDTKFDKEREAYSNDLALIHGTRESKGMEGFAALANKNGLKVKFEQGKSGVGKINVLGPDGKVVETITSLDEATTKLEQLATKKFQSKAVSLLGDEAKLLTYLNQREEIGIKREQLGIEKEYKGAGGVIDRAYQTGARGGKTTKKEVTNADIKSFITEFGDKPSYEKDPKTGKPIAIRDLPLAKQAAYANEFYLGRETDGGLPDVPEGGLKLEKPGAKKSQPASTALPRSFEGQKFGMLTPRSVVLEAAQAGNPDAIAFLEGMEKNRLDQELQRGNLGL
jgi:hypothetical protein